MRCLHFHLWMGIESIASDHRTIWYRKLNRTIGLWTRETNTFNRLNPLNGVSFYNDGKWQTQLANFFFYLSTYKSHFELFFFRVWLSWRSRQMFFMCECIWSGLLVRAWISVCMLQIKFGRWWLGWLTNRKPCLFFIVASLKNYLVASLVLFFSKLFSVIIVQLIFLFRSFCKWYRYVEWSNRYLLNE